MLVCVCVYAHRIHTLMIRSCVPSEEMMVPLSPTSDGRVWDIQLVTIAMVLSTAPIFSMGTLILVCTHSHTPRTHNKQKLRLSLTHSAQLLTAVTLEASWGYSWKEFLSESFSDPRSKLSVLRFKKIKIKKKIPGVIVPHFPGLENKSWSTSRSSCLHVQMHQVQTSTVWLRLQEMLLEEAAG